MTLKRAFDSEGEDALRQRILSYQIPVLPSHLTNFESINALRDIYSLCMQRQQDDRPTVKNLLALQPLKEQAKRLKINLGKAASLKPVLVSDFIEERKQRLEKKAADINIGRLSRLDRSNDSIESDRINLADETTGGISPRAFRDESIDGHSRMNMSKHL